MIELAWNYRSVVAKDINNTEGCSSVSKYAPRYFTIDWNKASKDWERVLCYNEDAYLSHIMSKIVSTIKVEINKGFIINTYGVSKEIASSVKAFSYLPCYISKFIGDEFGIETVGLLNFEDAVLILANVLSAEGMAVNLSIDGIIEITEEEFYKID